MENLGAENGELRNLINELAQGREAAAQLQMILNAPSSTSSASSSSYYQETRELLVHNVLSSYDKALGMLNYTAESTPPPQALPVVVAGAAAVGIESPSSFTGTGTGTGSPHSEDSDREHDGSRRRNALRWTHKVQVSPGGGLEGHLDDGYSWRKYGQKDILGARYPRGYYRCTYRHTQGCLATKQVQRSDEDPTIFDITYRGRHTCNHPNPPPQNQEPNLPAHPSETLLNFQRQLKVESTNLDSNHQENQPFSSYLYSFPSSSNVNSDQSYGFQQPNNFSWNISPSFGSPASSASSSRFAGRGNVQQTTEAQLNPSISLSPTNSPALDPGFAFGTTGFDSNFTFDHHGFFS